MFSATGKYGQYGTFAPLDCNSAVLSLNFCVWEPKNLGTVQHFCSPERQKCCTVPKIFGVSLKSAVLSLNNLKNLFSRTFRLGRP